MFTTTTTENPITSSFFSVYCLSDGDCQLIICVLALALHKRSIEFSVFTITGVLNLFLLSGPVNKENMYLHLSAVTYGSS